MKINGFNENCFSYHIFFLYFNLNVVCVVACVEVK